MAAMSLKVPVPVVEAVRLSMKSIDKLFYSQLVRFSSGARMLECTLLANDNPEV